MGTLFSALDIGRSGLSAAQIMLDITGNNIANVNTPGYSRQRAILTERFPTLTAVGPIGRGVQVSDIERIRDAFLDQAYIRQSSGLGTSRVLAQYYNLLEDVFLEPGDTGFGARIDRFFDALNDFANNVESLPVRQAVVAEAAALASSLNNLIGRFDQLRTDANEQVRNLVPEINSLAERISKLNEQIRRLEAGGQTAGGLRDERQVLLDQLSNLINITTQETSGGVIQVQIGGDVLVDSGGARTVIAYRNPALDPERNDLVELRFADNNALVDVRSGVVFGALQARDTVIPELDAQIDAVAAALIQAINSIHSQGNGMQNLSGNITSTNSVTASTDPLVSAGLPFTVTPGTFDVVVYDALGNPVTTTITITAATTLDDLATALNGVANFSASVSGGQITLGADPGFTFSFANDSSNVLPALGLNGLFTGRDARSIRVNPDIAANPSLLTSGFSLDPLNTGDNSAALAMADVRNALLLDSNSATLSEYYESTVTGLGIDARAANDFLNVDTQFVNNLDRRRQEVSGVNLDEEVTSLLLFQRAYEASARLITVTDRMLEALLNIAQ